MLRWFLILLMIFMLMPSSILWLLWCVIERSVWVVRFVEWFGVVYVGLTLVVCLFGASIIVMLWLFCWGCCLMMVSFCSFLVR